MANEITVTVDVTKLGPVFTGQAAGAARRYGEHVQNYIADRAVRDIRAYLPGVYEGPYTGYYQTRIHVEKEGDGLMVTDTPVVYGPWLEGVGSRDYPVTRFKGYHTFRIIGQQLDAEAEQIAEALLPPYLDEMN